MQTYVATNYAMGRVMAATTITAYSDAEARKLAEAKLPGQHAQVQGGRKGRVIGIKKVRTR